jgi:hypothetical protein
MNKYENYLNCEHIDYDYFVIDGIEYAECENCKVVKRLVM